MGGKSFLLFDYFQLDNYKVEFSAGALGTRLHFEYFVSYYPNSLISLKSQVFNVYFINVSLVITAFSQLEHFFPYFLHVIVVKALKFACIYLELIVT